MKKITPAINILNQHLNHNKIIAYRHEYKYEIDYYHFEMLKNRLNALLQQDSHINETGSYRVRSLYFDDWENSYYYDNEYGTSPREKFRIRIYNGDINHAKLELKQKENDKTLKHACTIVPEMVHMFANKRPLSFSSDLHPLLNKLYIFQETRGLQPVIIVEYIRYPFVYRDGNVRITLDTDIGCERSITNFVKPNISCRPIMPIGHHILEVKFDEFIPDHISQALQIKGLQNITFSKYYLSRKYGGLI